MSVNPQTHALLGMPSQAKDRMHCKLQLLKLLDVYRIAHDYTHQVAELKFCEAYNTGELALDDELRDQYPELSPPTLKKWRLKIKTKGVAALGGEYGNRRGQNCIDAQETLRDHIIGFLVQHPHARTTRVADFVNARFSDQPSVEIPSERTLRRWIEGWKQRNRQTYTALTNPDQWKNKFKTAFGSTEVTRLNERWELDTTPADLMLADGRYCLAGGIDVYSRRVTLLVTKTAKSNANAQLLRKKIIAEGKPESVKTDQGKDYVSHEFISFLESVCIDHSVSNKFSPWEKPHIERAFKTFSHDLLELLPGYIGHNVADAQELRARQSFAERLFEKNSVVEIKMTAAEFQAFCDQWCDQRYAHKQHEGLNGRTPFQMAAEWQLPIERVMDERALDLLLLEIPGSKGVRVVQKKGIQLPGGWFIAPELEAHIGMQVHCRYLDAGRVVCYSVDSWSFICVAVEPDLAGLSRQEIAAKAREMQKRRVQEERAVLRAIGKTINAKDAAAEILRDNAIESGVLVEFPKRAEQVSTPALIAAAQLRAHLDAPQLDSSSLVNPEEFAALRASDKAEREAKRDVEPTHDSPIERVYWLVNESYKRALSGEQAAFIEMWRKQHPREAQELDQIMSLRHRGKAVIGKQG